MTRRRVYITGLFLSVGLYVNFARCDGVLEKGLTDINYYVKRRFHLTCSTTYVAGSVVAWSNLSAPIGLISSAWP